MKFKKFEQSGFLFEMESGFRLALDIANKTPLEKLGAISCDAMLVSHIHGDHFSPEHIEKLAPKKLYLNQECRDSLSAEIRSSEVITIKEGEILDVGDVKVQVFAVDHGPNVNPLKENFGFLLNIDATSIYFAGDMFYPSGLDVSQLEVDIALIPVGTFYTFGPEEAFAFVKQFKRIGKVTPMHYEKTPETCGEFVQLAQGNNLTIEVIPV